jgi:hypothetical protein
VKSLPEKVDLFIFVLPASQFPEILTEIVGAEKAESIIVITGGLEEKNGTEKIVSQIHHTLSQVRQSWFLGQSEDSGPIINGGNCLGIRSQPGKCDTFFIPGYKLFSTSKKEISPLAIISKSGGFAC